MAETTNISWCDATWSPWFGCDHALLPDGSQHPGCTHCYAESMSKRNQKVLGKWGGDGVRVPLPVAEVGSRRVNVNWKLLRKLNAKAEKDGVRRRVFPSLCDPFEDWQGPMLNAKGSRLARGEPWGLSGYVETDMHVGRDLLTMADVRRDFFRVIDETPRLDYLLLTKRPQNVRKMWDYSRKLKNHVSQNEGDGIDTFRKNVWLLASISDQKSADAMIPELLKCRDLVPVLGVSAEPLLADIDFARLWFGDCNKGPCSHTTGRSWRDDKCVSGYRERPMLDWVIVGGESGPKHRPCHLEDITNLVDQCQAGGVACYVKQDCGRLPGKQNRIPNKYWQVKEMPNTIPKEPR